MWIQVEINIGELFLLEKMPDNVAQSKHDRYFFSTFSNRQTSQSPIDPNNRFD